MGEFAGTAAGMDSPPAAASTPCATFRLATRPRPETRKGRRSCRVTQWLCRHDRMENPSGSMIREHRTTAP